MQRRLFTFTQTSMPMSRTRTRRPGLVAPAVANMLLMILLLGGSIALYPHLPERMPRHFGITGQPDAWVETTFLWWMLAPIVGIAVALFVAGVGKILPRNMRYLNIPEKERFLSLPREQVALGVIAIRRTMLWIAATVLAMFCALQLEIYLAARSGEGTAWLATAPAVLVIVVLLLVAGLNRRLRRLVREES